MAQPPTRSHHQDYIARIRYVNHLPPPPLPPKLLPIPGEGLNPKHTSATYAARLLRDTPLNTETDAELGMPIDLVGLPGVFDNDYSALSGADAPPPPHIADRPLLRNYKALGANNAKNATFLRRNEFTASPNAARAGLKGKTTPSRAELLKRKRLPADDDLSNPKRILRDVQKSFALAYPEDSDPSGPQPSADEKAAWAAPTHPSNPRLSLLDAYPVTYDFSAISESDGFITVKFSGAPLQPVDGEEDPRTTASILRPLDPPETERVRYEAEKIAHEANPELPAPRMPAFDYEFFAPEAGALENFQQAADAENPQRDEESLYTVPGEDGKSGHFVFNRVRAYETERQYVKEEASFGEQLIMALQDGEEKRANLYPVVQRILLRPRRARAGLTMDEGKVDVVEVSLRDLNEAEIDARETAAAQFQGSK